MANLLKASLEERGLEFLMVVSDTMPTFDPRVYAVCKGVQHRSTCYGLVAVMYGDTLDGTWYFQWLREGTDISAYRRTIP